MGMKTHGGVGRILAPTVNAAGDKYRLPSVSAHLSFRALTNDAKLYFEETDFTNDENYWTLVSGVVFQAPLEHRAVWLKSVAGTVVEILVCCKG